MDESLPQADANLIIPQVSVPHELPTEPLPVYSTSKHRLGKSFLIVALCAVLTAGLIYGYSLYFQRSQRIQNDSTQKHQQTMQILNTAKGFILIYKQQYGTLPTSLTAMHATAQQQQAFLTDSWGNPLEYTANSDGTFTLSSNGPDGKPNTADDIAL
jgi:hypothetical protein